MINGDYKEFLDKLYYGEELLFEFDGVNYFVQGWTEDNEAKMVLDVYSDNIFNSYLWECKKDTMRECANEFLNAELWDGKCFQTIQNEVTWKE